MDLTDGILEYLRRGKRSVSSILMKEDFRDGSRIEKCHGNMTIVFSIFFKRKDEVQRKRRGDKKEECHGNIFFFFFFISKSRISIEKQTSIKLPKSTQEEYKRGETPPLSPIPQPS